MKAAYGFLGVVFVLIVGATYVLLSAEKKEAEIPVLEEPNQPVTMLTLTSPSFEAGSLIPSKYTCDGENVSPPIVIEGVPEKTESLVLLMDDPDIPDFVKESRGIEKFDHWVLYGIAPNTGEIPEGTIPGSEGEHSGGKAGYTGPCPPDGEHRYFFRLYALDTVLNFVKAPTLDEVRASIEGHILEETELIGLYERVQ